MNHDHKPPQLDPSTLGEAMIGAMKREPVPAQARQRTLAALGIGAGVMAAASAAGAAKVAGGSLTFILKSIGVALIAAAVVGAAVVVSKNLVESRQSRVPAVSVTHQVPTPSALSTNPEPPASSEAPALVASASSPLPAEARSTPPDPTSSGKRGDTTKTLTDEVRALDDIRTALSAGNGPRALSLIAQYRSSFPRGQLGAEALLLEIQALTASGQQGRARSLAKSFLARNPKSPLVPRVASLAGLSPEEVEAAKR